MQHELYNFFYHHEQSHWWFKSARKIQLDFVERYFKKDKNLQILDIGCGTGATLAELSKLGRTIGIDTAKEAISYCKKRGLKNVRLGNALNLPFKSRRFDLVTMFDVLEHINDDYRVLREIKRVLKPKGIAIFTVPAFMFLWDDHDLLNQHFRRYTKGELLKKLNELSFKVIFISYINFLLFPVVVIVKLINKIFNKRGLLNAHNTQEPFNTILYQIFSLEYFLLRRIKFPFGVSLIYVAQNDKS